MKKSAGVVCALLLSLTACGGGGEDATAKASLKAEILKSGGAGSASVNKTQAGCIADGTVDKIGTDKLKKYGILTDSGKVDKSINNVKMSGPDADKLAGVFVGCIDTEALFEKQFLAGAGDKMTAAQKKCITDAVDSDAVKKILSASFQGDTSNTAYADLTKKMVACAVPSK